MYKKTYNLKLPKNLKVKVDLRDVVPIVVNCSLNQKEVFKIAEAGLDLKKECNKIINLRKIGYSYDKIIELITEHNAKQ